MTAAPTPRDGERDFATKLICGLIDGPDGFNDPDSKHPDLRGYRKSWILHFTPKIAAHVAQRVAEAVGPLEAENRALREVAIEGLQHAIADLKRADYPAGLRRAEAFLKTLAPKEGNAP